MKPTQKQIELIKTIESIVGSWASTNDLSSPTHYGDIGEELSKIVLENATDLKLLTALTLVGEVVEDLLLVIQNYDRENKETE